MPFARKLVRRRLDKWDKSGKVFEALSHLDVDPAPSGSHHTQGRHYLVIDVKRTLYIAEYEIRQPGDVVTVIDLKRYKGPKDIPNLRL